MDSRPWLGRSLALPGFVFVGGRRSRHVYCCAIGAYELTTGVARRLSFREMWMPRPMKLAIPKSAMLLGSGTAVMDRLSSGIAPNAAKLKALELKRIAEMFGLLMVNV